MQKIEEIVKNAGGAIHVNKVDNPALYQRVCRAEKRGILVRVRKGIYALPEALAVTMIDVETIIPGGVVCLYSAMRHHGLSTQVPAATCVAIAANRKVQLPTYPVIDLYYWKPEYLTIGVQEVEVDGKRVKMTDPERTVCDAIRYRNKIGMDVCGEVLNDYLARPERNIGLLNTYARELRVYKILTTYLETRL